MGQPMAQLALSGSLPLAYRNDQPSEMGPNYQAAPYGLQLKLTSL